MAGNVKITGFYDECEIVVYEFHKEEKEKIQFEDFNKGKS